MTIVNDKIWTKDLRKVLSFCLAPFAKNFKLYCDFFSFSPKMWISFELDHRNRDKGSKTSTVVLLSSVCEELQTPIAISFLLFSEM